MKQGIFVWVGLLMLGNVTLSGDPLWAEERHVRSPAPDAELDMLEAFSGQAEWDIHWVRAMQGDEKAAARVFVWVRDLEEMLAGDADETLALAKESNVTPEQLMKIQFVFGGVYRYGIGTPRDEKRAAFWYRKSAEHGYAPAQLALEELREKGIELPKDIIVHKETIMPNSASSLAPSDEPAIGSATMEENGDIVLDLRMVVEELGIVGDAQLRYKPGEPGYAEVLEHLGGLKPGESKLVPPWPNKKGK